MTKDEIRKEAEKYGVDIAQPIIRSMFSCSRGQLAAMLSVAYLDGARRMNEEAAELVYKFREDFLPADSDPISSPLKMTRLALKEASEDIRALMPAEGEK
jgi:hypothetical protein